MKTKNGKLKHMRCKRKVFPFSRNHETKTYCGSGSSSSSTHASAATQPSQSLGDINISEAKIERRKVLQGGHWVVWERVRKDMGEER